MNKNDEIRNQVSRSYAKAIEKKSWQGSQARCCCSSLSTTPKGVAAKTAGYGADELGGLPEDAVENSFGCGNPLAFSGVKEGQTVVDLGAGAGIDILLAAKKVGPTGKAIGIDMTDEMIERAKQNIAKTGFENVEVRKGTIERMPVDDGSVDWVISNCVINLSPEKTKVFSEIHRVLKPGGEISVTDIVVSDLPEWVRSSKALYSSCVAGAVDEESYVAGLKAVGLVDCEVKTLLTYEGSQLRALLASEVEILPQDSSAKNQDDLIEEACVSLSGKIRSVRIRARKPTN